MEATLYTQEGKKKGALALPDNVFARSWNSDLVHQVFISMQSNARMGTAHTKNRGEVSGGGKKPWRQKGTGRARHGSSRSPLWVGGGVAHGPRSAKVYEKKINRKMKAQALFAVLSKKYKDNEILFVDRLSTGGFSAKNAKNVVSALSGIKGFEQVANRVKGTLLAVWKPGLETKKSFSNFKHVTLEDAEHLNVVDLLNHKFLVIAGAEEALPFLSGKTKTSKMKVPKDVSVTKETKAPVEKKEVKTKKASTPKAKTVKKSAK